MRSFTDNALAMKNESELMLSFCIEQRGFCHLNIKVRVVCSSAIGHALGPKLIHDIIIIYCYHANEFVIQVGFGTNPQDITLCDKFLYSRFLQMMELLRQTIAGVRIQLKSNCWV